MRQLLKAIILNGLGFLSAPLYLFSQFFEGKATKPLLGAGISAEHLNDDRLGRALDHFYDYGVTQMWDCRTKANRVDYKSPIAAKPPIGLGGFERIARNLLIF